MSDSGSRSWNEIVAELRTAASDVRAAVGRSGPPGGDEDAAAARLKGDVSRLEQSASDLLSKLSSGLEQHRSAIAHSFDRESAERSADQMKASLQELASLASSLTVKIASAAGSSLKQAEPELETAVGALENVAGSAAAWIRATIDPARDRRGGSGAERSPPLDDL